MIRTLSALVLFLIVPAIAQQAPSIELSSAFPLHLYQGEPRSYFMTTQYSASLVLPSSSYADMLVTGTYTQQQAFATQSAPTPFGSIGALNAVDYIPFTSEPYFSEYGFFSGIRLHTGENSVQAFVNGQFGVTAADFGTVTPVAYTNPDQLTGGPSYHYDEGRVYKMQLSALYGAGLLWQPFRGYSIIASLYGVDHLTRQPLDAYRSIGVHIEL